MVRTAAFITFAAMSFLIPATALAQAGDGAVAFDPEIEVVNSGALLDAQVVVSHDRKYVTINAHQVSLSRLQSLTVFPFQSFGTAGGGGGGAAGGGGGGGAVGFVGGAGFIDDVGEGSADSVGSTRALLRRAMPKSPVQTSPSEILKTDATAANSFLRRQGMMLLTPAP
jgi:hypothetical protein